MIKHCVSFWALAAVILAASISARGQVDQNIVSRALVGKTVLVTVEVAYAGTDSLKHHYVNTQAETTPVKTVISGVRNEGFLLRSGLLRVDASTHSSFPIGTPLRILRVTFEKNAIDLLLQRGEGGPFGDVRLKLNTGWQTQSSASLIGLIHKPFSEQIASATAAVSVTPVNPVAAASDNITKPNPITLPIPHNYALIFATDTYAYWPHLENPIADANAVNETLTTLFGFSVEEVKNASSEQILAKLTEYLHRSFQPQDQLLIFFSGHGFFDNDLGQGFIVAADSPRPLQDPGHQHLLAHDTIMHYVNRIPSRHVVMVLDACFAGTLDRRIAEGSVRGDPAEDFYSRATLPELLQRKRMKRTRRYFASGGKDFVPDGTPGHHSPFMSAFLLTLNQNADRKGYVTLEDIQQGLNTVIPEPRWGDIQDDNEPGADFLLLTPTALRQLSNPQ